MYSVFQKNTFPLLFSRPMSAIRRKRTRPSNENDVAKIGEEIDTPHIESWQDAIEVYEIEKLSHSDIVIYIQQLNECFCAKLGAVRRNPYKQFATAMQSFRQLEKLRDHHARFIITHHTQMRMPETEGAAKGWSLSSLFFDVLMRETRLLTAFEFMGRHVALKHNLEPDDIPECFDGVRLRKNALKTIPQPKLFFSKDGLGERLPIKYATALPRSMRFDPSDDLFSIENDLVLHPNTPFSAMSMLQLYCCWMQFANYSMWRVPAIDVDSHVYLGSLLACTAELCQETWFEEDGFIDMGFEYTSKSSYHGVDSSIASATVKLQLGGNKGISASDEKTKEDPSIVTSNRYCAEICSMFVTASASQILFHEYIKPHLLVTELLCDTYGVGLLNLCNCDIHRYDQPGKIFLEFCKGVEKWITFEMKQLTDDNFMKRVVDRMRVEIAPPCAYDLYTYSNMLTAPRDVAGSEEAWYGRNKMTYCIKTLYKTKLIDFDSAAYPPAIRIMAALFAFDMQLTMRKRDFNWLKRCFITRTASPSVLKGTIRDRKHPYIVQIDGSVFAKLDNHFFMCTDIFMAIAAWMIHVAQIQSYSMVIQSRLTQMHWLQDILRDITPYVDSDVFKSNFSRDVHPFVRAARDRFSEQDSEGIAIVY